MRVADSVPGSANNAEELWPVNLMSTGYGELTYLSFTRQVV